MSWNGRERTGHALVEFSPHPQLGIPRANLIDVFILPEHEGCGWSHALSSTAEHFAFERAFSNIEATLVSDEGVDDTILTKALQRSGWTVNRIGTLLDPGVTRSFQTQRQRSTTEKR